jgi:hypothetical protein
VVTHSHILTAIWGPRPYVYNLVRECRTDLNKVDLAKVIQHT